MHAQATMCADENNHIFFRSFFFNKMFLIHFSIYYHYKGHLHSPLPQKYVITLVWNDQQSFYTYHFI